MISYYEWLLEKAYKWVKIKWKHQRSLRESGLRSPSTLQMRRTLKSNTKPTTEQILGELCVLET